MNHLKKFENFEDPFFKDQIKKNDKSISLQNIKIQESIKNDEQILNFIRSMSSQDRLSLLSELIQFKEEMNESEKKERLTQILEKYKFPIGAVVSIVSAIAVTGFGMPVMALFGIAITTGVILGINRCIEDEYSDD
jgi:hypothetical protein